ncbi:MAG: RluA family pseudouridine synthase [Oligoflexia bacterium]|nr:RluA family pseudouridine synthase [Oligoflexia bacterium]
MPRLVGTATADHAPERLDRVALALFDVLASKSQVRKLARKGRVRVNGEPVEPMTTVHPGDELVLDLPDHAGHQIALPLRVVFEDAHLAVVYKPAGLVTSGNRAKTLQAALLANLQPSPQPDAMARPHPVHRLDARTQGLVICAKTHAANVALGRAFQQRRVEKRYRALLRGRLDGEGLVEEPVDGRDAASRWRTVEITPAPMTGFATTVDLWPRTGRKHQLRQHAALLGHPVLGDDLYTPEGPLLRGAGLFLAALELRLRHPITGDPLQVEADEPARFEAFRARARRRMARMQQGEG